LILWVEHNGDRTFYRLNAVEDFESLFQDYPALRRDLELAPDLKTAAEVAVDYISSHNTDAWIDDDSLSKTVKDVAMKLGMAALTLTGNPVTAGHQVTPNENPVQSHISQQDAPVPKFGSRPEDSFLWSISQVETSGGKNLNHPIVTSGPQKGQQAIGRWALLRPTINEFLDRQEKFRGHLPERLKRIRGMSRDQIHEYFQHNPDAEVEIARAVGRQVLSKQKGDRHRAAYSWLHGHNLSPESIPDTEVTSSPYVQNFMAAENNLPLEFKHKPGSRGLASVKKNDTALFQTRVNAWYQDARRRAWPILPVSHIRENNDRRLRDDHLDEPRTRTEKLQAVLRVMAERKKKRRQKI
jgi:hypothetical protein